MCSSIPGLYLEFSGTILSYLRCDKNVSRLWQMSLDRPQLRSKETKYIKVLYLALAVEHDTPFEDEILIVLITFFLITQ